jgi:signal transduction histidine kinase
VIAVINTSRSLDAFDPRFGVVACGVALLALQAAQWLGLASGREALAADTMLAAALLGFVLAAYFREKRAGAAARRHALDLEAAGTKLAHDLNNALHAVRGSLEVVAHRASGDPDVIKFVEMARRNSDRCAELVERFVAGLGSGDRQAARTVRPAPAGGDAMLDLGGKAAQDPEAGP